MDISNLKKGFTKSCGCLAKELKSEKFSKDITDMRFGKLVAKYPTQHITSGGNKLRYWFCECDCGNHTVVSTHDLLSGHTKSCSKCIHNVSNKVIHKRIYDAWRMLIARCENPKAHAYKNYGGRGIKVCEEWHDFETFLQWALSNGYENHLSIDRKNVNGNYEPSNCRWITDKEQNNNRRNNHHIEYKGVVHTLSEWAEIVDIPYATLVYRISKGWSIEDAFFKPLRVTKKKVS